MNLMISTLTSPLIKLGLISALLVLSGCATLSDDDTSQQVQQSELSAEEQLKQLEAQIQTMKSDWEQQKPALERLVTNEEDLQFLIKTLSDMSQIDDAPSRSAFLGKTEMTTDQREAIYSISHVITNQQQLLEMVQNLTELLKNTRQVTAGSQTVIEDPQPTEPSVTTQASTATLQPINDEIPTTSEWGGSNSTVTQAATPNTYCECDPEPSQNNSTGQGTSSKSTEWFGLTQPYQEAAPAMGSVQQSQLDSNEVNNGQPIPGLVVKQFSRKTLPSELAAAGADVQAYNTAPIFQQSRKSLSDYVAQLAFKLAGNQQLQGAKVGVASFVFFDSQLEQTSAVGNQLAEELSTVLPAYGASVIEYKLTKHITVGPTGDLSLSRSTSKLRTPQGMDYVLTGTMVPTRRGLQINSRVVSTQNNVVISSATTLIPALVLQQL